MMQPWTPDVCFFFKDFVAWFWVVEGCFLDSKKQKSWSWWLVLLEMLIIKKKTRWGNAFADHFVWQTNWWLFAYAHFVSENVRKSHMFEEIRRQRDTSRMQQKQHCGHENLHTWNVCWVVVSNIFYFHPSLRKIPILANIFQRGWNHQLGMGIPQGESVWIFLPSRFVTEEGWPLQDVGEVGNGANRGLGPLVKCWRGENAIWHENWEPGHIFWLRTHIYIYIIFW